MAYQVEDLTRLKHLLEFGERFLGITDSHDSRIAALEAGTLHGIYYGTKEYWRTQTSFVPEAGAIVIYSDYATVDGEFVPNFKVGDGMAYVVDLPFSQDDLRDALLQHINDNSRHLNEQDREKLENSVTVSVSGTNLIFQ